MTLGLKSYKMLVSTLYMMWPMHLQSLKLLRPMVWEEMLTLVKCKIPVIKCAHFRYLRSEHFESYSSFSHYTHSSVYRVYWPSDRVVDYHSTQLNRVKQIHSWIISEAYFQKKYIDQNITLFNS